MAPFTEYYQGYECNVMLQDYTLIDNPLIKSQVKQGLMGNFLTKD